MARNSLDEYLARRAAEYVLEQRDLCPCPIQVIRLAREVPQDFIDSMECDCQLCVAMLQLDFARWIDAIPEKVKDFHRPGASAAATRGEKRDDDLIGPAC